MAMKPIGVSQLNAYIKRILQTDPVLSQISVLGEISNLKYHDSGHVYFSLKDSGGKINCFLPHGVAANLSFRLEDGMEVVAMGNVSVFERGGYYSLQIRAVELSGAGDLYLAYEQLKDKLLKEGLFDAAHKKPLCGFPRQIAILTSATGAALQDMLKIIKVRNTVVNVLIYPVLVQGPDAPADIANGIRTINRKYPAIDGMIVGRGGGSLEELWAFNDEKVARSIYESDIPVVSAVGHETDVTIADFVADVRAETPTAAASLIVPDTHELSEYLDFLDGKLHESILYFIEKKTQRLSTLNLDVFRKTIADRTELLGLKIGSTLDLMRNQMDNKLNSFSAVVSERQIVLESLNPKAIMRMGYAAIRSSKNQLITGIDMLHQGDNVSLVLTDGYADATIQQVGRNDDDEK